MPSPRNTLVQNIYAIECLSYELPSIGFGHEKKVYVAVRAPNVKMAEAFIRKEYHNRLMPSRFEEVGCLTKFQVDDNKWLSAERIELSESDIIELQELFGRFDDSE
jgi:hypothetical protein